MSSVLESKIHTLETIAEEVLRRKEKGERIVFTNGCFDLLHLGHVDFLERARDFGDYLIVAVNTDSSVRRLGKGPTRPIQSEASRVRVIAALGSVGAAFLFDDDTPYEIIKRLEPDVLVKGGDYTISQIVGHDLQIAGGREVYALPLIAGHSTTALEHKIIQSHV